MFHLTARTASSSSSSCARAEEGPWGGRGPAVAWSPPGKYKYTGKYPSGRLHSVVGRVDSQRYNMPRI
eukprot:8673485-Pyramimonas_sp.AAC.1